MLHWGVCLGRPVWEQSEGRLWEASGAGIEAKVMFSIVSLDLDHTPKNKKQLF